VLLGTGLIVAYSYVMEWYIAWYSHSHYEQSHFINRTTGPYAWAWAIMTFCNVIAPQLLWSKRLRQNLAVVMFVAMCVNIGMWFERFVIIVTSLHRDFLPSSWGMYMPTWVDLGMFAGSFGLFFTMFLLFCRFLPMVAMAEVKTVMPEAHPHEAVGNQHRWDYQPDERDNIPPLKPGETRQAIRDWTGI
jgi:molybdopterin-containing oxidoreductase family membrane subunit